MASRRLAERQASGCTDPHDVDFLGYVPRISPHLIRPDWLAPLGDVIRRSFLASAGLGPPVFACVDVPPQHGKTSMIQHAIACWLKYRPQDPIIYATYNRDLSREKSRETRDLAVLGGCELRDDSRSLGTWTTAAGGGLRARAIVGGALTGTPGLRWIVIDDPYKGRAEAESTAIRRAVWGSFNANIVSRLHTRTSVLINHTRWHDQDLIGQLLKEQPAKWEHVHLPAINDAGEALWPEGQPLSLLQDKRERGGEYEWWSLYMGEPRPREGKLFQGIAYYSPTDLPSHRHVAIGVDLSYSGKTSSDWSVAVVMAESGGRYYVLDVVRRQCSASAFAADLVQLSRSYPGAPMRMYASGSDWEQIEIIRKLGAPLSGVQATTDKFIRAQPLAAAWKRGVIALCDGAPWLGQYTSVVMDFTGLGDTHDDDVDASAAAYDALPRDMTGGIAFTPQNVVERRAPRDPAINIRGKGRLGAW